jgi:hypothetical protein
VYNQRCGVIAEICRIRNGILQCKAGCQLRRISIHFGTCRIEFAAMAAEEGVRARVRAHVAVDSNGAVLLPHQWIGGCLCNGIMRFVLCN